ncbi:MAG: RnfABCDGE type electron transport complex subunit B [Xanthomonadales bacterium]|nr:RnfABCDGE type electron transport complex subunit B [Xanthomonadales bacterium]
MPSVADRIDALLPQTQCTRCGYPTCRAYAEAIAEGSADIDRCPPGGADGVAALAGLLGRASKPLDPDCGSEAPPTVALIDEEVCIGCTKCIQACPVDAIVGAGKHMHTVIADECTGCGLCLPPCPVDCIALVPTAPLPLPRAEVMTRAAHARARFEDRKRRLAAGSPESRSIATEVAPEIDHAAPASVEGASAPLLSDPKVARTVTGVPSTGGSAAPPISRAAVLAAIARGRARRAAHEEQAP